MVKKSILFLAIIFLIGFAFAGFEVGTPSSNLTELYGPGQEIQGWVNISFSDEPTTSIVQDSRGSSATLADLLNANSWYIFFCSPSDCSSDYSASNVQTSKSFSLNAGEEATYGLKFEENIDSISSIKFDLTSNAAESFVNQIKVDILDDDSYNAMNENIGSQIKTDYQDAYGCFNSQHSADEYALDAQYCQKINLTETPSANVGAWIKKISGDLSVNMSLYDPEGSLAGECGLNVDQDEGIFSCQIDYLIKEKNEYFVCIYPGGGSGDYRIKGYATSNGCGFYGQMPSSDFDSAYEIFAKPTSFGAVGTINIKETLQTKDKFSEIVTDYITNKYGNLDCSSSACVVPIKFHSSVTQSITIKNLVIDYYSGGHKYSYNFYDLTESPAKVNSDFGKFYINDGNFTAPSEIGNFDFVLNLDGSKIINTSLKVEDMPVIDYISPVKTASALPTKFEIETTGKGNISKFIWDFGDNSIKTTFEKEATHIYNSTGQYNLKITLEDSLGRSSSKTFIISVGSPEEIIEEMLAEKKQNLDGVLLQMEEFKGFQKQKIEEILNLDYFESELNRIDLEYSEKNKIETELNAILTDLLAVKIPEYVIKGASADDLVFYPESGYINLDALQAIGGGEYDYSKEDSYIDSIIAWNQIYLTTRVSFDDIYASFDGQEIQLLTIYEISLNERENAAGQFYFIIENLDDLTFEGYAGMQEGDYTYLTLTGSNTISFSSSENIDFADLPVFISPSISKLDLVDIEIAPEESGQKKWLLFGLAIFLLVLIGIAVYFALHVWYTKKYENYLFKDKNNLYNLINYIHSSIKKGMNRSEIVKNLKKAKWTNEQINYVMKKYAGKGTGMPGLIKEEKIEKISNEFGEKKVAKK